MPLRPARAGRPTVLGHPARDVAVVGTVVAAKHGHDRRYQPFDRRGDRGIVC